MPLWLQVFGFAMLTAVATGLGALPFFAVPKMSRWWLGIGNALAAGLMLGASVGLLYEGYGLIDGGGGLWRTLIGAAIGMGFIIISAKVVRKDSHTQFAGLENIDAKRALLLVAIMTLHSVAEGVGVGVAFGGGRDLGLYITLAIAIHNIPEGLAISLVMVPRGTKAWKAGLWSIFTSLPQPVMAVPAFLLVEWFSAWLPVGLGFAAGAMIWMAFAELLPDSLEDAGADAVAITATASLCLMMALQVGLG